ncbi:MAG: hypothetical protein IJ070_01035, partial [Firmicutes bacterium]|nr:hypothetical protein [Bacillota bacterium]
MVRECGRHKRKSLIAILIAALLFTVCQPGFAQEAHAQGEDAQRAKLLENSAAATKTVAASSVYEQKSKAEANPLKDERYECDAFGWSGGSGRLKYIRCSHVTIDGGKAYAEIEFSSDRYDAVKVAGQKYENKAKDRDDDESLHAEDTGIGENAGKGSEASEEEGGSLF